MKRVVIFAALIVLVGCGLAVAMGSDPPANYWTSAQYNACLVDQVNGKPVQCVGAWLYPDALWNGMPKQVYRVKPGCGYPDCDPTVDQTRYLLNPPVAQFAVYKPPCAPGWQTVPLPPGDERNSDVSIDKGNYPSDAKIQHVFNKAAAREGAAVCTNVR